MKKLIRTGVFETNSSSSHSLSLGSDESKDFILQTIYPDENGNITVSGGEYGWEYFKYNNSMEKLNYVAQNIENDDYGLSMLENVVKNVTGAENVYFDLNDGYVDHDSRGIIPVDEESLKDLIFNKNSWIFGGNDNSSIEDSFYDVPTYCINGEVKEIPVTHVLLVPDLNIAVNFTKTPSRDEIEETIYSKIPYNVRIDGVVYEYVDENYDHINNTFLLLSKDYQKQEIIKNIKNFHDLDYRQGRRALVDYIIENKPNLIKKIEFNLIEQ